MHDDKHWDGTIVKDAPHARSYLDDEDRWLHHLSTCKACQAAVRKVEADRKIQSPSR